MEWSARLKIHPKVYFSLFDFFQQGNKGNQTVVTVLTFMMCKYIVPSDFTANIFVAKGVILYIYI